MAGILLVDDEPVLRKTLSALLTKHGHYVACARDVAQAKAVLKQGPVDIAFIDIRLGQESGITLLDHISGCYPQIRVIMISAYASIPDTTAALEKGAFGYIAKPVRITEMLFHIKKILQLNALQESNRTLRRRLGREKGFRPLIGESQALHCIREQIARVTDLPSPVLVYGESGTGKEMVAKAVHWQGRRAAKPFVGVNCSALPPALFESEFFGHSKGAFTHAIGEHQGFFSQAADGTLYLDDIDDMPQDFQPKLLRVLQEGRFRMLGGKGEQTVRCRVVASAKADLRAKAEAGRFRRDLFYRLNIINIFIPPLRTRVEDILPLAQHFLKQKCRELDKQPMVLAGAARDLLMQLDYPGNVRELENLMERAVIFSDSHTIGAKDIHKLLDDRPNRPESLKDRLRAFEAEEIAKALSQAGGHRQRAARSLGISLRSLLYKIKDYGLSR